VSGGVVSGGVARFTSRAAALGEAFEVLEMPGSTHTAVEAAEAVGCRLEQIVKSLVFDADGEPLLVLASGPLRVDTALVGEQLGVAIGRADARAVKSATGYSIGGVPPFCHDRALRTVVDRTLLEQDELWAAAGSATSMFRIAPADLVRLSGGAPVAIAPMPGA
jgi:prolyl-tRNA editing enzyme YbaK/EbsC (Cys-tRNA(Pro) deacylase)